MIAGFCAWLLLKQRHQWFVTDEFDYFARPSSRTVPGWLILPHNEHTIVFTKAWFGLLGGLFGLRHYWLYALPLVLCHGIVAGACYHLVLRASRSRFLGVAGTSMVLAMGAASGTLLWAGQLQYVGCVAAGLVLLIVALSTQGSRMLLWVASLCVLGTFNGSSFLPFGLAAALVFVVRRRFAPAVISAGIPVLWAIAERLIWHPSNAYAAKSLTQILEKGSVFAFTIIDTAVSQSLREPHLGAPVLLALILGTLAVASARREATLTPHTSAVCAALGSATVAMIVVIIAGRLNRTTADLTVGGYSYLALATLIPLSTILLAERTRARRWGLQGAVALLITIAGIGFATLSQTATDYAAWRLGGRALLQSAASSVDQSSYPEQVAAPSTAPTVTHEDLRRWAKGDFIDAVHGHATDADQVSLNTQWRLSTGTLPPAAACTVVLPGEQVDLGPGKSPVLSTSAGDGSVVVAYPEDSAQRTFSVGANPSALQSVSGRAATLTVSAAQITVCGS